MGSFKPSPQQAIIEDYLYTPTSNRIFELGYIYECVDSAAQNQIKRFMYVKSAGALVAYQPYTVVFSNTAAAEVVTAAPVTLASGVTVCIPQVAFTSGYYGFVQITGECTALLSAEAHVPGDYLELLTTGTTLVVDGTSAATTYSPKSVAIQIGTLVGAGSTTVNLFGGVRASLVSAS